MHDEPTPRALPAVLYAAKSTSDRKGSIPDQLEDCQAMAEREGMTVAAEYRDEGFSAYSGNRGPGLSKAKEHAARLAEEHGEAVLLVWASDRLARGAGDAPGASDSLIEVFHELARLGVRIRSVHDDQMLTNPLLVAFAGWRGNEESRVKGERVKAGARRRAERGNLHGGGLPYGYRRIRDPETGLLRLEPEPAEAEVVRRMFGEYVAGRSQRRIARDLGRDGIRTKRDSAWAQGTVRGILQNPFYRGAVRLNGEEHEGAHAAIIEPDLWYEAARLREAIIRSNDGGHGPTPKGRHLLLHGLLRCGICGGTMLPRTIRPTREGGEPYERYVCRTRNLDLDGCGQPPVERALIDQAILTDFERRVLDVEATRERMENEASRRLSEARALRERAERDLTAAESAVERVQRDYLADMLSAESYEHLLPMATSERDALAAQVGHLRDREREAEEQLGLPDADRDVLERLTQLREAIAGAVRDASDLDAARAAIASTFESFTLTRLRTLPDPAVVYGDLVLEDEPGSAATLDGYALVPEVRSEAIAGYETVTGEIEVELPILRRIALNQAENSESGISTPLQSGSGTKLTCSPSAATVAAP